MSETTAPPSTIEVNTELGEAIVAHEQDQHANRADATAPKVKRVESDKGETANPVDGNDAAYHDAFFKALEDTRPVETDKDRVEREDREAARQDREARNKAEKEDSKKETETEEPEEPSPLEQFAPKDVKDFADKFGLSEEDLANPKIAAMLASRMSDQQETANRIEPPIPQVQDEQRFVEHLQGLAALAQDPQINDPRMVQAFEQTLAQCFDAQSPEAMQSVKGLSSALTQGGISLISTIVPQIIANYLPSYLEQHLPGLAESHRNSTVNQAWKDVRASNPSFRGLPDLGTPEFEELRGKVLDDNPWMGTIQFRDGNNQPLRPDHPQAIRQHAALFARLAKGEQFDPAEVQKAIDKGRLEAQRSARRVSASRSMGAGKSKGGEFGDKADTSFRDAIVAHNAAQKSGERR